MSTPRERANGTPAHTAPSSTAPAHNARSSTPSNTAQPGNAPAVPDAARLSRRRMLGGAAAAAGAFALTTAAFNRVSAAAWAASGSAGAPSATDPSAAGPSATGSAQPTDPALTLWFDTAGVDWQNDAFPIGNGWAGAMIFGGVQTEQIQFNNETLWTGGPGSAEGGHDYTFGNWDPPRPGVLDSVRATINTDGSADEQATAGILGQTKWGYGAYQTFGDIFLTAPAAPQAVSGYRRDLDLSTGLAHVTFVGDGVTYDREYFASYPDGVTVARLTASRSGHIDVVVSMTTADNRSATVTAAAGRITMRGSLQDNGLVYEAQLLVLPEGGTSVSDADGTVTVTAADALTLLLAHGTNYVNAYPHYRGADPHDKVTKTLDAARRRSYPTLRDRHVADHGELFGRVRLDIGQQPSTEPTYQQLNEFKAARSVDKTTPASPELEALHFHIGRYLLISSAREGTLPPNLQGVWNDSTAPDWQDDYTTNINLEMNYWPSDLTNLPETVGPLADFIQSVRAPGRVTARQMCGAGGWAAMNHLNIFGYTGVSTNASTWSPESTGWLLRQLWEHYEFTRDEKFLRSVYPVLKEHVQFWMDYLVVDPSDGTLVVSPSYSPEHGPFTNGCSYSQMVVWDLLTNTIAATEALGVDKEFRASMEALRARLDPGLRIGGWGQLQEWKQDLDDPTDGHRHLSHAYALFPGNQITAEGTPEYFAAAGVSIRTRTANTAQNDIGWNRAQKVNLFARLHDGNMAREQMDHLLWRNTFSNFLNDWPFQIDGNFGVTSGLAEMLLQSHAGFVHVLPALPDGWAARGSYDGLRARGAFTVGTDWAAGVPTEIRVSSDKGADLRLRSDLVRGRFAVSARHGGAPRYRVDGDTLSMPTTPGNSYTLRATSL